MEYSFTATLMNALSSRDATDPAESKPYVVNCIIRNRNSSCIENEYIQLIKYLIIDWSSVNGVTASMDNVECVIVDPQDGGNWFARSGTDSVSELASKVRNLLIDGKHIRVFVFLIPDAMSRVEEYVCVQIHAVQML